MIILYIYNIATHLAGDPKKKDKSLLRCSCTIYVTLSLNMKHDENVK